MGQRRSNAAMKDVQNRYRKEEYVPNTERRDIVAMKDVPSKCRMEECLYQAWCIIIMDKEDL